MMFSMQKDVIDLFLSGINKQTNNHPTILSTVLLKFGGQKGNLMLDFPN